MIKINKKYAPIISGGTRYVIIGGGRGSGKSFSINTILCLMMLEQERRILFLRKTLTSAHMSIIPEFVEKLDLLGVTNQFNITKTEIVHKTNGSAIFFRGATASSGDNTANLKSLQGISLTVFEECEEFTDEEVVDRIDLSVRQKGVENKVMFVLNPTSKSFWLYKRFYESAGVPDDFNGVKGNCTYIHTTYLDNIENLDPSFVEQANELKKRNPDKYKHLFGGAWKEVADGVIFTNWSIGDFVDTGYTVYGADFGFSNDENTLIKVSVDKKNRKIYAKECLYQKGLTTSELYEIYKKECGRSKIIGDSSEPRLLTELKQRGINIDAAIKGQGSVTAGIAKILDYDLIVDPSSKNLMVELNNYCWLDKAGKTVPIDKYNHLIDAMRYAVSVLIEEKQMRGTMGALLFGNN